MARSFFRSEVSTVGDLKRFLDNVSDDIPIKTSFDEPVGVFLWEAEEFERGQRKWIGFDEWDL